MARLYPKYDDKQKPIPCYLSNSKWYKNSGTFSPRGILIHDTAINNTFLHRYVMAADNDPHKGELDQLLGKNPNNNDWNHGGKDKDAGLHFVGTIADGKTVTTLQTVSKKYHPHILRHTHVALLAEQGIPLEAIARRLGHMTDKTTRDVYYHVTKKQREKDEQAIAKVRIL